MAAFASPIFASSISHNSTTTTTSKPSLCTNHSISSHSRLLSFSHTDRFHSLESLRSPAATPPRATSVEVDRSSASAAAAAAGDIRLGFFRSESATDSTFTGDVLLHCVVDAILGALGLPDIGQIFPDSDPKWKGAPSSVFIKEAEVKKEFFCLKMPVRLMHEAGYEIGNLDATLILQRPKLSPHKEAIRTNLSELLGADPSVVNLKAKTHEKVDSLGENRSIAAHTVVLLMRK
ncbi:hypothetical protein Syun_013252 [Stephania yunnanensis]|uniref:2-C-methyl-D-erythritol 2,4-cyclodiphosphate synthase n=1 Tax=Stephania yunnanensis TaxID=152371 RepID=A0AAP0K384_9MAGN